MNHNLEALDGERIIGVAIEAVERERATTALQVGEDLDATRCDGVIESSARFSRAAA